MWYSPDSKYLHKQIKTKIKNPLKLYYTEKGKI